MSKHDRDLRGGRDVAGSGPDPRTARHLTPLRETKDFKIVGDDPDIRGWHVFASNGRELGVVDDLLVDVTQRQVVSLDVIPLDADPKDYARPHATVPIKAAWVDRENKRVVLDGAQFDHESGLAWQVPQLPIVEAADRPSSPPARGVVVEEHVVRRRVVDPDELDRPQ